MGKNLINLLKTPVFVYTFGLFFLVYKSSLCFKLFDPLLFLCFFAGFSLITYILILIQKKVGLYKYGVAWLVFLWILILFLTPINAYLITIINPSFIKFKYLVVFVFVFSFFLYKIKERVGDQIVSGLNYFLNIFVLMLTVMNIFSGLQLYLKDRRHNLFIENRKLPSLQVKDNTDIIWILLDEYASPASLISQFNFKDSMADSLNNKGFYVFNQMNSRSDTTIYSINSLFNLDDTATIPNYFYGTTNLNKSRWIERLNSFGYEFISSDFLNVGGYPKLLNLDIFPDNYGEQILSSTLFMSIKLKLFPDHNMPFDNYNQLVVNKFHKDIYVKRSKPTFIWTHLLIPHPPFYRNAKGDLNENPVEDTNSAVSEEVIKQYTGYISYANTVILKMLNDIPDWKRKTIIISGDHGARMLVPEHDPRRKQTFCAIYYPGMDKQKISKIKYLQQIPFYLH